MFAILKKLEGNKPSNINIIEISGIILMSGLHGKLNKET